MRKTTSKTPLRNPFTQFRARYIALWGMGLLLGCVFGVVLFYRLFASLLPVDALLSPILLIAFYATFGAWLLSFLKQRSIDVSMLLGPIPRRWPWPRLAALVALLLLCSLGSFLFWLGLRHWLSPEAVTTGLVTTGAAASSNWFAQLLKFSVLVTVAPVVEEVLFRGILLQRWAVRWGIRPAILLSSLVFGSVHGMNPIGFTLFGLVMALLYVSTRSLLVPIACHMLNNVMAEFLLLMFKNGASTDPEALAKAASSGIWQGLLLLAIALPLLTLFIRQSWPRAAAAIPYLVNQQQGHSTMLKRPTLARGRR